MLRRPEAAAPGRRHQQLRDRQARHRPLPNPRPKRILHPTSRPHHRLRQAPPLLAGEGLEQQLHPPPFRLSVGGGSYLALGYLWSVVSGRCL